MNAFEKRMAKDEPFFPAFLMVSVTETCNLACKGSWVSRGGRKQLTLKQLDGIISEGKKHGAYFYGLLGGEPLMYKGLLDVMEKHSDCYFQLCTNGTLITDDIALRLKRMGNVTPLISIEGLEEESDLRRQRDEVFNRTLRGALEAFCAGGESLEKYIISTLADDDPLLSPADKGKTGNSRCSAVPGRPSA